MVTGAIALALGEGPSAALVATLAGAVNSAAQDIESSNPQFVGQVGFGRLDIEAFLSQMGYVAPAPTRSALLVARLPLSASDQFIHDRLELLGFGVTTVGDSSSSTSQAGGKDLVVISQTVTAANVNSKFRDVAVPVLTWEDLLFDDMSMSSSTRGDVGGHDSVAIATDHPLAAGFSGDATVYLEARALAYGTPSAGAITVATVPGDANKAVIFAYEAGAGMVGMDAPAKRVGFFFHDDVLAYDYRGATLFDAAVQWASYEGSDHVVAGQNTYLEAENYSALSGSFSGGSADVGSYMAVTAGIGDNYHGDNTLGSLNYDLDVQTPDTYYLWLRVYGPDGSSDSFYAEMDDGGRTAEHFGAQGQWLWKQVSGSFYLSGAHSLTISHREDGARLDRILLTTDASFTPSGQGGY